MSQRLSPLHDIFAALGPEWCDVQGMAVPVRVRGDGGALTIRVGDASCLPRLGVKGMRAAAWLASQGFDILPGVNSWLRTPSGLLVARLARSEFFLEDNVAGATLQRLRQALVPASGVTPVMRQDAALVLTGARIHDLLTQVCNINFLTWQVDDRVVVMTTMVGVSVLVLWDKFQDAARYRLWCDPTFAPYLCKTLVEIAGELGGGASGIRAVMPEVTA